MAEISLDGVAKSFGAVRVLHGIDLTIDDGAFAVIVGPSGCGKSTLLRLVAGLEEADAGTIRIAGRVVNRVEPKDRDIAMVFQNYALYPHMTVLGNMSFGLELRGLPRTEIRARVERAAGILQIGELLGRKPRQLSGGQRQRVAMGRAIVREPAAFLFDEPLSNLDAKLRVEMRLEIRKLHQKLAATRVYVTHDQVEAMTMADVLIVMNGGRIEQVGAPLDVYRLPASSFVAGFIGSPPMNFLSGRVSSDGGSVMMNGATVLPLGRRVGAIAATAGVRPEHLALCPPEAAQINLRAALVEPHGAETIVHGTFGSEPLTVRLPGIHQVAPGDALPLRVEPEHLHLFDPATGLRLS